MGFFSWFREIVEDIKFEASYRFDQIKDWFADKFGNSNSYDSKSVESRVDVEKDLADFRNRIADKANSIENQRISDIICSFNAFIQYIGKYDNDSKQVAEKERDIICQSLKGTIINYVKKHASENDPKLKKILEMEPGEEKKEKSREIMDKILADANRTLNKKLEIGMNELYGLLYDRLTQVLHEKDMDISKKIIMYEALREQIQNGELDVQEHEEAYILAFEVYKCIESTMEA